MEVYKFDKNFKGRIEPMPGDVVELEGVRLKVVGDSPGEECSNCVLDNIACPLGINQMLLDRLCMCTKCDGVIRADGITIHYEEASDAT